MIRSKTIESIFFLFKHFFFRLCVNVDQKGKIKPVEERIFIDFDSKYFWQWTDFQSYVEAIMSFLAFGCILMFFMLNIDPFVETVGFLAVFTEAMLGTPQFYKNFKNKSTYGMSLQMVVMWTCGDIFKTSYFVLRQAPVQFVVCGCLQIGVDIAILTQVWMYKENSAKKKKSDLNAHY